MGKKGKKTRWRRLPIGGTDDESGLSLESAASATDPHRVTFNEDEYTKITTPRQDVLFKKGYFGRKRTPPDPSPTVDAQDLHSGDSMENESYVGDEPQYVYPPGYMDPTGVYYMNGNTFETYDPYTGTVTVVVGPPPQYPGGPPVLAALPCQPVPLQPVEWFNPPAPWCYSYNRRKRYSTDSQNCSAQSSESTGPPGSPQEPIEEGACAIYPPQYVYPGYMFGPPIYNMNGVTVQGVVPQPIPLPPDLSTSKRRKKRRRRRRGGVTDDGSESSCCEEPLTCDMAGCQSETSQSGASSDAGAGPNSDSGINTNSGSNSPPLVQTEEDKQDNLSSNDSVIKEHHILPLCSNGDESVNEGVTKIEDEEEVYGDTSQVRTITPEISEELSVAEDEVTPNLCASAPDFSSQESTLSCLSTPSAARDLLPCDQDITNADVPQGESCLSVSSLPETSDKTINFCEVSYFNDTSNVSVQTNSLCENSLSYNTSDSLTAMCSDLIPINPDVDFKICSEEIDKVLVESAIKHINPSEEALSVDLINNYILEGQLPLNPESDIDVGVCTDVEVEKEAEVSICREIEDKKVTVDQEISTSNEVVNPKNETKEITVSQKEYIHEVTTSEEEEIIRVRAMEEEEVNGTATESLCSQNLTDRTEVLDNVTRGSSSILLSYTCTSAPIPPPRRKRIMGRAADRLATKIVEKAIKEGIEEATCVRLTNPLTITEAVTRWLNSHESSPLTYPASESESENDDEGIEVGEGSTDQKNVRGNPFLVSSHSDGRQRVANDCVSIDSSAGEWDMWDQSHTHEMCDPTRSVDKYYRLGADEEVGNKVPPSVYKTAMHIRHTGPFPCGVCCIIQ